MNEYEIILEALQYQVDCGELTLEEAELVNECAYDRYVCEKNDTKITNTQTYKNKELIENEIKFLEKFEKVVNALDEDKQKLISNIKSGNKKGAEDSLSVCRKDLSEIKIVVKNTPLLSRNTRLVSKQKLKITLLGIGAVISAIVGTAIVTKISQNRKYNNTIKGMKDTDEKSNIYSDDQYYKDMKSDLKQAHIFADQTEMMNNLGKASSISMAGSKFVVSNYKKGIDNSMYKIDEANRDIFVAYANKQIKQAEKSLDKLEMKLNSIKE